jgi:hypothetical protein
MNWIWIIIIAWIIIGIAVIISAIRNAYYDENNEMN